MSAWLGGSFLLVGFILLVKVLRLVQLSRWTLQLITDALTAMGDRRLDDVAGGSRMRHIAGQMVISVAGLILGVTAALLLPAGALFGADRLGLLEFAPILEVALSPAFILVSSVVLIAAAGIASSRAQKQQSESSYSFSEQLLYKLAFCTAPFQKAMAKLEDRFLRRKLSNLDADHPIFITALPRAGTTLILECCARLDILATHRYRDMPFVGMPVLWARLTKRFQKEGEARERAHGDNMLIDFNSPEALEEVLWLASFRRPYKDDRILTFRPVPRDRTFKHRLRQHFRKIIYLRCGNRAADGRYVSKNNMNISRLGMLRSLFPKCTIVVPFRDPLQHCLSLLRQHKQFLKLHAEDAFASEYMRQIGHFDFGENLCPIDFDCWLDQREHRDSQTLGFWLEYWVAAYSHVFEHHADHVNFFDYDELCEQPARGFQHLGQVIGLKDPESLARNALDIRPPRHHERSSSENLSPIVARAREVWQRLKQASQRNVEPAAVFRLPEFARAAGAVAASDKFRGTWNPEWKVTVGFAALLLLFSGVLIGARSVAKETRLYKVMVLAATSFGELRERFFGSGLPRKFLQPSRGPGEGVLIGADLDDGKLVLVSSFFDSGNELRLMRRDGSIVARWPLSYFDLFGAAEINDRRPATEWNVDVHGIQIHPNGDVVLNFEYFGTVRLSRCGRLIWRLEHATHHSVEFAEDGGYWILGRRKVYEGDETYYPFVGPAEIDSILKVTGDGAILSEVPIPKIFADSGLTSILTSTGENLDLEWSRRWDKEIVHANKIEELTTELAPAFPMFEAGDLLLSIRNYNLLAVVDPDTWRIKWHQIGPYVRQHDPSFTPDGTIKLFNNNAYRIDYDISSPGGRSGSNIMQIDPKTGEAEVLYGDRGGQSLKSIIRGQQEVLPGGGFLIVEFEGGRVVEVDVEGNKVWEYVNRYNEEYVAEVTSARLLDAEYFNVSDWSCPEGDAR